MKKIFTLFSGLSFAFILNAQTYHPLATSSFSQDWTNIGLITTANDWSGVPSIIGYRGDDIITVSGVDPQTVLGSGTPPVVNVIANQSNPNTLATGGVAEFDGIANPVVALQGSGTADAPNIVIHLNTTGRASILVSYLLRDIDGSSDNSIQSIALQYRIGNTGDFINIPAGFVLDASSGPDLATLTTPVSVTLPADADNQPMVEVRILTTNAAGSDEWIGIDDIMVSSGVLPLSLTSFSAVLNNGKTSLVWNSSNEVNVKGFSVEKSLNAIKFSEMVFVEANNRSTNTYSATDEYVKAGVNYYRLKMIDKDGSYRYSNITTVSGKADMYVDIFPNPVVNSITVRHDKALNKASIVIVTMDGRQVKSIPVQAGATQSAFSLADLVKGNYMVIYTNNGERSVVKFSKQ